MNDSKLYHIENFDSYNNIYVIYKKHKIIHKRIESLDFIDFDKYDNYKVYQSTNDHTYLILADYIQYIPVYGHYYNNSNQFICKKIVMHQIQNDVHPGNFLLINDTDIARSYKGGIFICNNIDEQYDVIKKIKNYELTDYRFKDTLKEDIDDEYELIDEN